MNAIEQVSIPAIYILESIAQILFKIVRLTSNVTFNSLYPQNTPANTPPLTSNTILKQTAVELAENIRTQRVTSHEVVSAYVDRIKTVNGCLNAVVDERFQDALAEAKIVDATLQSGGKTELEIKNETPFLGVPFTVKGSLAVKGLHHTVGVQSRKDIIAESDAHVVELLRKSGAIPLCVTNTAELCCWWESSNPLYGTTKNPYNENHTAGGSSGGEGALIAAAASIMGLGSDFGGSIRIPAAFNGIFGHRPTSCATPLVGHYPLPPHADHQKFLVTGPMTRFATDLLPLMRILTTNPDLNLDQPVDISKVRVFYMEDDTANFLITPVQPEIKQAIQSAVEHLRDTYGVRVEKLRLRRMKYAMLYWYVKIKTELEPQLGKELANHKGCVNIPSEFVKCLTGKSKHTLPVLVFGLLEKYNISYKGLIHKALLRSFDKLRGELQATLGNDGVFLYPTHPTSAPRHKEPLTRPFDIGYSAIFNVLEMPSTTCPAGFDANHLPIGIQIVSNANLDRFTIAVAVALEKYFGGWQIPDT